MEKLIGSYDYLKVRESIKNIELLTKQFKKNRIKTDEYIIKVNENLYNLTNQRDYIGYLKNIGQL
jgi:hypothetical protein